MDFLWRSRVAAIVKSWSSQNILDLATGSGDLALAIHKACPKATVLGADFCFPMLRQAAGKGFARLVHADAMQLPFQGARFDGVTVAFGLRNMKSWDDALREMARILKPGGHLLVLDFSLPTLPVIRPLYRFYLHRILPAIAGCISGNKAAYAYLGDSIEKFPSGTAMMHRMEANGYEDARAFPLMLGIVSIYTARRKS